MTPATSQAEQPDEPSSGRGGGHATAAGVQFQVNVAAALVVEAVAARALVLEDDVEFACAPRHLALARMIRALPIACRSVRAAIQNTIAPRPDRAPALGPRGEARIRR